MTRRVVCEACAAECDGAYENPARALVFVNAAKGTKRADAKAEAIACLAAIPVAHAGPCGYLCTNSKSPRKDAWPESIKRPRVVSDYHTGPKCLRCRDAAFAAAPRPS